jgi:hypothetical protein
VGALKFSPKKFKLLLTTEIIDPLLAGCTHRTVSLSRHLALINISFSNIFFSFGIPNTHPGVQWYLFVLQGTWLRMTLAPTGNTWWHTLHLENWYVTVTNSFNRPFICLHKNCVPYISCVLCNTLHGSSYVCHSNSSGTQHIYTLNALRSSIPACDFPS